MTFEKQCEMLYKIDNFVRTTLLTSKFRILQAFGAFGINLLMGYCYATVLQLGYNETKKRKRRKK